jgi:hypothetical protein
VVDRARFKTLSADVLAGLVKSDELELIYAHLSSMRNFQGMRDRLAKVPVSEASDRPGEPGGRVERRSSPKPAKGQGRGKSGNKSHFFRLSRRCRVSTTASDTKVLDTDSPAYCSRENAECVGAL